jgi:hydrogenase maturation protease
MMGDDAAGPIVIDRLAQRVPPSVELVESVGDATHLLETWRDAGLAIVVDAVVSDGAAGSIKRVDGIGGFPSAWRSASTHLVGLAEAIDLGDAVGVLPGTLVIYGIEIDRVEPGVALSPAIDSAADDVVESILDLCEGYVG